MHNLSYITKINFSTYLVLIFLYKILVKHEKIINIYLTQPYKKIHNSAIYLLLHANYIYMGFIWIAIVIGKVTGNANLSVDNWRNPSNRTFRLIYKALEVDNLWNIFVCVFVFVCLRYVSEGAVRYWERKKKNKHNR